MNSIKVSIIIATYNSEVNLSKTLSALKQQDYNNIECVIVDGGSTDRTLEIIKKFEKEFQGSVQWKSEKDNGIFDAINKGIVMSNGDIIGCYWDVYSSPKVISTIVKKIVEEGTDGVHGDLVYMKDNKEVRKWKMGEGSIYSGWMPAHPTLYLKKEVYEKYGFYKTSYKISGDYEFMVRALKDKSMKLSYIPELLIYMFYGGVSSNGWTSYKESIKEGYYALKENHIRFPLLIILLRMIRTSIQFI